MAWRVVRIFPLFLAVCQLAGGPARGQTPDAPKTLTLDQAIQLATERDQSLQMADARLDQAEAGVRKAWSLYKPHLNASGSYYHHDRELGLSYPNLQIGFEPGICGDRWSPEFQFCLLQGDPANKELIFQRQDSLAFTASLNQTLVNLEAISLIKNARTSREVTRLSSHLAKESVAHAVTLSYFAALSADQVAKISQEALALREQNLNDFSVRKDAGESTRALELKARIELHRARLEADRARDTREQSYDLLGSQVGLEGPLVLVPPVRPKNQEPTLDELVAKAQTQRLDLAGLQKQVLIAEELERKAWYSFLPQLNASGMFRVSDTRGYSDSYTYWNVGLVLQIPLYDGGLRYAEMDEAQARTRLVRLQIEEQQNAIRLELRSLLRSCQTAQRALEAAQSGLALAEEQEHLALAAREAGTMSQAELADARHLIFLARAYLAQEELNFKLSRLRLERALTIPTAGQRPGIGNLQP